MDSNKKNKIFFLNLKLKAKNIINCALENLQIKIGNRHYGNQKSYTFEQLVVKKELSLLIIIAVAMNILTSNNFGVIFEVL